jgi:hypothetical protein
VLASFSLSLLLSGSAPASANVGLPTLAQAFTASFQEVQWIVLEYLLAISTRSVKVGIMNENFAATDWPRAARSGALSSQPQKI